MLLTDSKLPQMTEARCGYIALLGLPNAGKSSLLNSLVGTKLVGVSKKAQTTRAPLRGIVTVANTQLIFIDTPGFFAHKRKASRLGTAMNQSVIDAAAEADMICYLVDCTRGLQPLDLALLRQVLSGSKAPWYILLSKCDRRKKKQVAEIAETTQRKLEQSLASHLIDNGRWAGVMPCSAKQRHLVDNLQQSLARALPEGPWQFDPEDLCDRPTPFIVNELVREQLFRQLGEELPYSAAVRIDAIDRSDRRVAIAGDIVVERMTHKGMVIGRQGSQLKEIGSRARESLEQFFGLPVHLDLHVKLEKGWREDPAWLERSGF